MRYYFYNLSNKKIGPLSMTEKKIIQHFEDQVEEISFSNGSIYLYNKKLKYKIDKTIDVNNIKFDNFKKYDEEVLIYLTEDFNTFPINNFENFNYVFILCSNINTMSAFIENIEINKFENKIFPIFLGNNKNFRSLNNFEKFYSHFSEGTKVLIKINDQLNIDDLNIDLSVLKKIGQREYIKKQNEEYLYE